MACCFMCACVCLCLCLCVNMCVLVVVYCVMLYDMYMLCVMLVRGLCVS